MKIKKYYAPSDSYEWFNTETNEFENNNGQVFRDESEYDVYSEGYTPFGDE